METDTRDWGRCRCRGRGRGRRNYANMYNNETTSAASRFPICI